MRRSIVVQDNLFRGVVRVGAAFVVAMTFAIGIFLLWRGSATFTTYDHSVIEFLFSTDWNPTDSAKGGGKVGAGIFIIGSLLTCAVALLIATPFSIGAALFMTEISPKLGRTLLQPTVEIFVGIPSVVYGWLGLTILVPFIKNTFQLQTGFSVLAASIVLAVMIFPTITSIAADAIASVPKSYRQAGYGLGATRWQVIYQIVLPSAKAGILSGVVLGLARAFGEALAVAMVIGKTKALPESLLSATTNLTSAIASDMGGAMEGSELNMALWSMALLLFLIAAACIACIHLLGGRKKAYD